MNIKHLNSTGTLVKTGNYAQDLIDRIIIRHIDLLNETKFTLFILIPNVKVYGYKKFSKPFLEIDEGRIRFQLGTINQHTTCEYYLCFGDDTNLLGESKNRYSVDMALEIMHIVYAAATPINLYLNNEEARKQVLSGLELYPANY